MSKKSKSKKKKIKTYDYNYANPQNGLFAGLREMLPSRKSDQFLAGLLLGAAAAYILSDEEIRARLIKGGIKLYSGIAGGIEEIKEQFADIRAELEAENSIAE
ncbi:MAG: hypothetical protein LBS40_03985 [Burkholderiales bacterium]|jgi:hypothetical protein|nr:hypothetical protein [Burkholderiales bacterium]